MGANQLLWVINLGTKSQVPSFLLRTRPLTQNPLRRCWRQTGLHTHTDALLQNNLPM